ncbi:MAG: ABC transporter ATP-binding protein [Oscillospiraceae bacterium]|jgi:oligopeptide/dipeptide ABC transporter ATP-binding protein|nr:ABC transporter ATP-binding protein [Oscillospiraceae bacterium]
MGTILEVKNYSLSFDTPEGEIEAVRDVNFSLNEGEILAIVGESGCGKTVLCKSLLKLLPRNARVKSGKAELCGENITAFSERRMRQLRGKQISMVFQDPLTTLNPTIPIGKQITESIRQHQKISHNKAKAHALELLELVGIDHAADRFNLQPHFFSGGMRQRCVLAIALASHPKVLLADEPTTALDVTVQAKMLDLLLSIRKRTGIAILFVSHDLGVVARIADRVAVMYAGKIVEIGTANEIFYDSRHPYTWGLLGAQPALAMKTGELHSIPGMPPVLLNPPPGDTFAVRNKYALAIDYEEAPPMFQISPTHFAATWLLDPRAPHIDPPIFTKRRREE